MENTIKFITWKIAGLRKPSKRKTIVRLLKGENFTFSALLETYLKHENLRQIEREWAGVIHQAPGSIKSKGLLTLFSNKIKKEDIKLIKSSDRFIISELKKEDKSVIIINTYSLCDDREKSKFLDILSNEILSVTNSTDEINCLRDFNSVLDNALGIISGHNHNIDTVRKFNRWVKQLNVYDIWRQKNPTEKRFSWNRNKISRRLDYIFLGKTLQNLASDSYIKGYGFSDH